MAMAIDTSILDVAQYILERSGEMTTMKLQKLCYYSQAWYLVWNDKPLFKEGFEAWANGPVCKSLYCKHRGLFIIDADTLKSCGADSSRLTQSQRDDIDTVIESYNQYSGYELSELTHNEAPWKDARGDLRPGERGNAAITNAAMAEYYGSLV